MSVIKISPHGSFKVTQLGESVVICEAPKDPNNWGNATKNQPAFLVYLGCKQSEVKEYVETFNSFYKCSCCEVRKPKYLKVFEKEIKIYRMRRNSSLECLGLDYLMECQQQKEVEKLIMEQLTREEHFQEEILALSQRLAEVIANRDAYEGIKPNAESFILKPDPATYKHQYKKCWQIYRGLIQDEF